MLENLNQKSFHDNAKSHEISLVIGPTEVADVMTAKVVTLSPHHTFNDVANLMSDRYFRHCVIVDSYRKAVGVISDRDIFRALARNPNSRSKSLDQIMTRNPITVKRSTLDRRRGLETRLQTHQLPAGRRGRRHGLRHRYFDRFVKILSAAS